MSTIILQNPLCITLFALAFILLVLSFFLPKRFYFSLGTILLTTGALTASFFYGAPMSEIILYCLALLVAFLFLSFAKEKVHR